MAGGLDYIFINLTDDAAYLAEVSRVEYRLFIPKITKIDYISGKNIFVYDRRNDLQKFSEQLKKNIPANSNSGKIVVSVPTAWGQVKVLPRLKTLSEEEQRVVWEKLLDEAFSEKTAHFNVNFLPKDENEVWCIGLGKSVVSRILGLFPGEKRGNIIIVPDMALYQGYYESLKISDPAIYISGDGYRECWFMDGTKTKSEYRLIFPDSGFPEVTYHKSLEDFIMFLEKKYGLELEKIYLVEAETEGKMLADLFGDRLLDYTAIPRPETELVERSMVGGKKRLIENLLMKIYSAAELIN